MKFLIFAALIIPSATLLGKHLDWSSEIIIQFVIVVIFLYLGYRLLKAAGSCLKIIGLGLLIFGLIAYYLSTVQPLITNQLFGPKL